MQLHVHIEGERIQLLGAGYACAPRALHCTPLLAQ